jgi:DNA repair ATPase RecN
MEQNSQLEILESQIREIYGRVVWTHKTQEKCADIIWKRHMCLKVVQVVLSALTTTGILIAVFGESKIAGISSAILSTLTFGLSTYTKDYDLGEIAQKHSTAAITLWNVREKYLSLIADLRLGRYSVEEIYTRRDELQTELYNTYKGSPRTINKAYQEASKALTNSEEMTFSNQEIDKLLPSTLRLNKK